ncbi:MAG: hypothetical protein PBV86_12200 [Delftia lacustris]|uniref:hypothetical protein n=1 Tax=Delftia lacustris TaxID=558537 RepID=UPI002F411E73
MKTQITYLWRYQNHMGRWRTTRFDCTEEFIRKSHPEAVMLPETRVERIVPDTEDELMEAMCRSHGGGYAPGHGP